MSLADYHANIRRHIAEHGFSLTGVGAGEDSPEFIYTIGLAELAFPELLIIGFMDGGASRILYALAKEQIATRQPFLDGGTYQGEGWLLPVRFVAAQSTAKDELTIQAGVRLGHDAYDVLQVVIPDEKGRWPHEAGCTEPYRSQLAWQRKLVH